MIDIRCKNCNRLLAKATTIVAAIKCPSCKMLFEYKSYTNLHITSAYDIKGNRGQEPGCIV